MANLDFFPHRFERAVSLDPLMSAMKPLFHARNQKFFLSFLPSAAAAITWLFHFSEQSTDLPEGCCHPVTGLSPIPGMEHLTHILTSCLIKEKTQGKAFMNH